MQSIKLNRIHRKIRNLNAISRDHCLTIRGWLTAEAVLVSKRVWSENPRTGQPHIQWYFDPVVDTLHEGPDHHSEAHWELLTNLSLPTIYKARIMLRACRKYQWRKRDMPEDSVYVFLSNLIK